MRTAIMTTWNELSSLKDEWNPLLKTSRSDTIFLTWEWIQSWRAIVGDNLELFVVTVRNDQSQLVGIAPFYRYQLKLVDVVPYKALRILADYATGSEYSDWIVSPDCENEALDAITDTLLKAGNQWDAIWMPHISGWNGSYSRIKRTSFHAKLLFHSRTSSFSSIPLPDSMSQFEQGFSSKRRKNLRRLRRNLLNRPGVNVIQCRNQTELPRFVDALFDLHHKRRSLFGDPGCFIRKPAEAAFYRHFLPIALDSGWLRFIALTQDDTIEAIQVGYTYNGEYFALQEGYNPEYISGVGNVLRHVSIEQSIDEGLTGYDFLGAYTKHKRLWRAQKRTGYNLLIGRPSIKNRILFSCKIWPTGRALKEYGLFDGNL